MGHDKKFVRNAFASIARRYDLLNTLLSFGIDASWRRRTISCLSPAEDDRILDLCAGTLTLSRDLLKACGSHGRVVSIDFCEEMLIQGRRRLDDREVLRIGPVCGDAESLPVANEIFDGATVTYGIRNLADIRSGLVELHRVLRPGARLVILDFLKPRVPVFAGLYRFYLERVLPRLGGMISGSRTAYQHLADSIEGFMDPDMLCALLEDTGYESVRLHRLTLGIAGIFHAKKG